jgi:hypothetical protein
VEDWLNAYEEACAKYIDDKIDRKRFRQLYRREVRQICEASEERQAEIWKLLQPESTSSYSAIWKVYKEWKD